MQVSFGDTSCYWKTDSSSFYTNSYQAKPVKCNLLFSLIGLYVVVMSDRHYFRGLYGSCTYTPNYSFTPKCLTHSVM